MGEPGKEAPTNVAKDQGHSSVSVDLLTTTVTNKNSQEVDHVGQLSGEINNLQEDVTTRKSRRTKKNPSIMNHHFLW